MPRPTPRSPVPPLDPETLDPERLLTLGQLAKLLPGVSAANHAHRGTVRRWTQVGVTVRGKKIRLPVRVTPGGQRLVRWGDWLDFRRACEQRRAEAGDVPPAVVVETPVAAERRGRKSQEAARKVMAELRREMRKGA